MLPSNVTRPLHTLGALRQETASPFSPAAGHRLVTKGCYTTPCRTRARARARIRVRSRDRPGTSWPCAFNTLSPLRPFHCTGAPLQGRTILNEPSPTHGPLRMSLPIPFPTQRMSAAYAHDTYPLSTSPLCSSHPRQNYAIAEYMAVRAMHTAAP